MSPGAPLPPQKKDKNEIMNLGNYRYGPLGSFAFEQKSDLGHVWHSLLKRSFMDRTVSTFHYKVHIDHTYLLQSPYEARTDHTFLVEKS